MQHQSGNRDDIVETVHASKLQNTGKSCWALSEIKMCTQALADNEETIMKDLIDCQGPPCDVGGYYKLDAAKAIIKSTH